MDELERMLAGELGNDSDNSESESNSSSSGSDSESEEVIVKKKSNKKKNKKKAQAKKKYKSKRNKKEEKPAQKGHVETENKCFCGSSLFLIEDESFYGPNAVYCDVCERDLDHAETFFHCMRERSPDHPQGFDVCSRCVLTGRYRPTKFKQDASDRGGLAKKLGARPLSKRVRASTTKIKSGVDAMVSSVNTVVNKTVNGVSSAQVHKNYLDTAFGKEMRESAALRERLVAENKQHLDEIQKLKDKLKQKEKEKDAADATIKSVKTQVTNLILKNEEMAKKGPPGMAAGPAVGGARPRPVPQPKPAKMSMDPEFKKGLKKMVQKVKGHDKQMEKLEKVMGNMYKLFSSKFEDLSTRMILVETRVNALVKKDTLQAAHAEVTPVPAKPVTNPMAARAPKSIFDDDDDDDGVPTFARKPVKKEAVVDVLADESYDEDDHEEAEEVEEEEEEERESTPELADLNQITNPLAL